MSNPNSIDTSAAEKKAFAWGFCAYNSAMVSDPKPAESFLTFSKQASELHSICEKRTSKGVEIVSNMVKAMRS